MNFVEVAIRGDVDSGELLALLEHDVLGSWEAGGASYLYYSEEKWDSSALDELKGALSILGVEKPEDVLTVRVVPDQDWNSVWAASLTPVRIGERIVIRQSWHPADERDDAIELVIDPRRAFGTGYHATTQLVVEWLEENISGGERVLDAGTGSGILSMAAIRLGAASALAFDNDPVAIECAAEYCRVNGFGPELELRVASFEEIEPGDFDVVLANMDIRSLPQLCRLLPGFLGRGGKACLSGLLHQDVGEVAEIIAQQGMRITAQRARDEWVALEVRH